MMNFVSTFLYSKVMLQFIQLMHKHYNSHVDSFTDRFNQEWCIDKITVNKYV